MLGQFLKAHALGLRQHEDGDHQSEQADESGDAFGQVQSTVAKKDGKEEHTNEAADLTGGRGDAVTGGAFASPGTALPDR